MATFVNENELRSFLSNIGPFYSGYSRALFLAGAHDQSSIGNASVATLTSLGIDESHAIDLIAKCKATGPGAEAATDTKDYAGPGAEAATDTKDYAAADTASMLGATPVLPDSPDELFHYLQEGRLVVPAWVYRQWTDNNENLKEYLRPSEGNSTIAEVIHAALIRPTLTPGLHSEAKWGHLATALTYDIWHQLYTYSPQLHRVLVHHDWNRKSDEKLTTVSMPEIKCQPDSVAVAAKLLLSQAEQKKGCNDLTQAINDMISKNSGGYPARVYHGITFMTGYVSAANQFKGAHIQISNGKVTVDKDENLLDMNDLQGRIKILLGAVNLYRLLKPMLQLAPEEADRMNFSMELRRGYRELCKICFKRYNAMIVIEKEIAEPAIYFRHHHTCSDHILAAYEALQSKGCTTFAEIATPPKSTHRRFVVRFKTLGFERPLSSLTQKELFEVGFAVIDTLDALHANSIGHCDVRFSNVLFDQERPFMIDLEAANKLGFELPEDQDGWLAIWRRVGIERSSDGKYKYTHKADLKAAALILKDWQVATGNSLNSNNQQLVRLLEDPASTAYGI